MAIRNGTVIHSSTANKVASEERDKLEQENLSLQAQLSLYFQERQFEVPYDFAKKFSEGNVKKLYHETLDAIKKKMSTLEHYESHSQKDITELENVLVQKEKETLHLNKQFYDLMRSVAKQAVYSTTGECIPLEKIEMYITRLGQEEQIKREACFEYTKEHTALLHAKEQKKALEEKDWILNMNDYELLVAETHFTNSKNEQRRKEVKALLEQIWNAVNVATHLRQKLAFLRKDKMEIEAKIEHLNGDVKCMTEELLTMKAEHQAYVKAERQKLQQKNFFLQNSFLLEDYEKKKIQHEQLLDELQNLKKRYAEASKFLKK